MTKGHFITSFIKMSIITTALFGSLVAQSYATNAWFSAANLEANINHKPNPVKANPINKASISVHKQSAPNNFIKQRTRN